MRKYAVTICMDVFTKVVEAGSEDEARERAFEELERDEMPLWASGVEPYREPVLTKFGAIEIDMVDGVWYLPKDWSEFSDQEVRDAWHLATPAGTPRPIDAGYGLRVLGDIRSEIEAEMDARGIELEEVE